MSTSSKAKRAVRRLASKAARANCPTPEKRAYADANEAIPNALHRSKRSGKPLRIYVCQCGSRHLMARVLPKKAA